MMKKHQGKKGNHADGTAFKKFLTEGLDVRLQMALKILVLQILITQLH
jgi:hypothetical protein